MNPQKVNAPLTRRLFLLTVCLVLVMATGNFEAGLTQSSEQRRIKTREFKDMPLKVLEVRNLQKGENWVRDLEVEVENVSGRPIYYVSITLELPDILTPPPRPRDDGTSATRTVVGFILEYGSPRLLDVKELAAADDAPLRPGERYIFKVPDLYVKSFASMKKSMGFGEEATKNVVLDLVTVSFGDGSGYLGGRKWAYPAKSHRRKGQPASISRLGRTPALMKANYSWAAAGAALNFGASPLGEFYVGPPSRKSAARQNWGLQRRM